jgi:hypothetical protein
MSSADARIFTRRVSYRLTGASVKSIQFGEQARPRIIGSFALSTFPFLHPPLPFITRLLLELRSNPFPPFPIFLIKLRPIPFDVVLGGEAVGEVVVVARPPRAAGGAVPVDRA